MLPSRSVYATGEPPGTSPDRRGSGWSFGFAAARKTDRSQAEAAPAITNVVDDPALLTAVLSGDVARLGPSAPSRLISARSSRLNRQLTGHRRTPASVNAASGHATVGSLEVVAEGGADVGQQELLERLIYDRGNDFFYGSPHALVASPSFVGEPRSTSLLLPLGPLPGDHGEREKLNGCFTALTLAVWRGDLVTVQALLSRGADPNAAPAGESERSRLITPLGAAAERGDLGIVTALLEAGARPRTESLMVEPEEWAVGRLFKPAVLAATLGQYVVARRIVQAIRERQATQRRLLQRSSPEDSWRVVIHDVWVRLLGGGGGDGSGRCRDGGAGGGGAHGRSLSGVSGTVLGAGDRASLAMFSHSLELRASGGGDGDGGADTASRAGTGEPPTSDARLLLSATAGRLLSLLTFLLTGAAAAALWLLRAAAAAALYVLSFGIVSRIGPRLAADDKELLQALLAAYLRGRQDAVQLLYDKSEVASHEAPGGGARLSLSGLPASTLHQSTLQPSPCTPSSHHLPHPASAPNLATAAGTAGAASASPLSAAARPSPSLPFPSSSLPLGGAAATFSGGVGGSTGGGYDSDRLSCVLDPSAHWQAAGSDVATFSGEDRAGSYLLQASGPLEGRATGPLAGSAANTLVSVFAQNPGMCPEAPMQRPGGLIEERKARLAEAWYWCRGNKLNLSPEQEEALAGLLEASLIRIKRSMKTTLRPLSFEEELELWLASRLALYVLQSQSLLELALRVVIDAPVSCGIIPKLDSILDWRFWLHLSAEFPHLCAKHISRVPLIDGTAEAKSRGATTSDAATGAGPAVSTAGAAPLTPAPTPAAGGIPWCSAGAGSGGWAAAAQVAQQAAAAVALACDRGEGTVSPASAGWQAGGGSGFNSRPRSLHDGGAGGKGGGGGLGRPHSVQGRGSVEAVATVAIAATFGGPVGSTAATADTGARATSPGSPPLQGVSQTHSLTVPASILQTAAGSLAAAGPSTQVDTAAPGEAVQGAGVAGATPGDGMQGGGSFGSGAQPRARSAAILTSGHSGADGARVAPDAAGSPGAPARHHNHHPPLHVVISGGEEHAPFAPQVPEELPRQTAATAVVEGAAGETPSALSAAGGPEIRPGPTQSSDKFGPGPVAEGSVPPLMPPLMKRGQSHNVPGASQALAGTPRGLLRRGGKGGRAAAPTARAQGALPPPVPHLAHAAREARKEKRAAKGGDARMPHERVKLHKWAKQYSVVTQRQFTRFGAVPFTTFQRFLAASMYGPVRSLRGGGAGMDGAEAELLDEVVRTAASPVALAARAAVWQSVPGVIMGAGVALLAGLANLVSTGLLMLQPPATRLRSIKGALQIRSGDKCEALCMKVPIKGIANSDARELLHNLLDAKLDPVCFGSPVVKALITYKWRTFARLVLAFLLFDHLIYMGIFIMYATSFSRERKRLEDDYTYSAASSPGSEGVDTLVPSSTDGVPVGRCLVHKYHLQLGCIVALSVMTAAYCLQEARQALNSIKSNWLHQPLNLLDVAGLVLMFVILGTHIRDGCDADADLIRGLCGVEVLILFLRLFYYAMPVPGLGGFVSMVLEVVKDLSMFFIFLGTLFVGFSVSYMVMQPARTVSDVFSSQFVLIFGNFDLESSTDVPEPTILYQVLRSAYQILVSIIMLNLLIAIINESYDRIREAEKFQLLRNQATMIAEIEALLPTRLLKMADEWFGGDYLYVLQKLSRADRMAASGQDGSSKASSEPDKGLDKVVRAVDSVKRHQAEAQAQLSRFMEQVGADMRAMQQELGQLRASVQQQHSSA